MRREAFQRGIELKRTSPCSAGERFKVYRQSFSFKLNINMHGILFPTAFRIQTLHLAQVHIVR